MDAEYNGVMPIKQDGWVNINSYWTQKTKLEPGVYKCHVLGLAQDSDEHDPYPVFIVKLGNGIVIPISVTEVRLDERQKSVIQYGDCIIEVYYEHDKPKAEKVDRGDLF